MLIPCVRRMKERRKIHPRFSCREQIVDLTSSALARLVAPLYGTSRDGLKANETSSEASPSLLDETKSLTFWGLCSACCHGTGGTLRT
jgi:hypothetical protein